MFRESKLIIIVIMWTICIQVALAGQKVAEEAMVELRLKLD